MRALAVATAALALAAARVAIAEEDTEGPLGVLEGFTDVSQVPLADLLGPEPAVEKNRRPPVLLRGRVHTRYGWLDRAPHNELEVVRARLALDLQPEPWLFAQLDVDAVDLPIVKDAYVVLQPVAALGVTIGQFKKPFSRLELTSSGKLPLWRRGIVNDRLTRNYGYGGRDVGVMLLGRAGPFTYAAGAFNGTRTLEETDSGKDVAARLALSAADAIDLGVSGSMLHRNPEGLQVTRTFAASIDGRLRTGPLDSRFEVIWAQEPLPEGGRDQLGAMAYVVLRTPRIEGVSLRPIVKVELLDEDTRTGASHATSLMGGVNLDFRGPLRVLLQYEQVWGQTRTSVREEKRAVAQVALDFSAPLAVTGPES